MEGRYRLNGSDLYTVFGTVVEEGSGTFLSFPTRKPSLQNDWSDRNGLDVDLAAPKFSARDFRLRCALVAASATEFWNRYNGLFTVLAMPGVLELYVADHESTYKVYFKRQDNISKLSTVANTFQIGVKFDLVFGETDWQDNIEKVYLVDDEGRYLIA